MPNPYRLSVLEELRRAAGVTLEQMAQACGLAGHRGRLSVSAWEQGHSKPHARRRTKFIDYLGMTLRLRDDPARFRAVWAVLVEEWDWDEVSEAEWQQHFDAPPLTPSPHVERGLGGEVTARLLTDRIPHPVLLPPGSRMPFSRNPLFVGRRAELQALALALKADGMAAIVQPNTAAATGMGGIGKTQLACEFVHRYGQFFTGGVFWLSFADPQVIAAEVAACGGPDFMNVHPGFERLTLEEQAQLVRAAWHEPAPRLLIFDNCEDPALLAQWRPEGGGCRVLLTSRRQHWNADSGVHTLPLAVLDRHESTALLRKHCPDLSITDLDLTAVAAELDDLPLALHLAGSFLARRIHDFPPAAYLRQLREAALLNHPSLQHGTISPTGHAQHVARTFAVSYNQLDPSDAMDALARALLVRAAYFAPGEPIPRDLLLAALELSADAPAQAGEQALLRLIDLGLLEPTTHHGDNLPAAVRMHRLLVAFAREIASDSEAQTAVERAMVAKVRALHAVEAYPQVLALQAHLRAVTHAAQERQDMLAADLCYELGEHLLQLDDYAGARQHLTRSIDIRSAVLGDDHPSLARGLHRLAWSVDAEGQPHEALQYHQRALAIRRAALGDEHDATGESWSYVGTVLHAIGDFAGAEEHYQRAYAIRRRTSGEQHTDTATCLNNLGLLYLFWGRYAEACTYLARALAIREQTPDVHRAKLAISLNNMGYLLRVLARYAEAQPILERALRLREELFGPDNTYVAVTLNHLGRLFYAQGNYERAHAHLDRALTIMQARLPDCFWVGNILSSMGMLCYTQHQFAQARTFLERAVAIHEQVYQFPHWHTARSLNHLAMFYHGQGNCEAARCYYEQALNIREQLLGGTHPDTANTVSHIGMLHLDQCEPAQAAPLLARALAAHKASLGFQHPYTARSLMRVGLLRRAQGHEETAQVTLTHALSMYEQMLGTQHPYTVACRQITGSST